MKTLKIATRQSPLALWQAEHIRSRLNALYPDLTVELVKFVTQGDKILDTPLAKIGGKGLFVKELEAALLDGRADLAVHSMKDVPMHLPEGLSLAVICEREDPLDAFVSNQYQHFDELPQGAKVGTSSLRRKCQILQQRPDLEIIEMIDDFRRVFLEEVLLDLAALGDGGVYHPDDLLEAEAEEAECEEKAQKKKG